MASLLDQYLSLFAFLSTLIWLIWLIAVAKKSRGHSLPPGPQGVPILGYLPFLGRSPDLPKIFTKLAREYGPIYKFWLGRKICMVVSSPALARQIFREHDKVFANHDLSVAGFLASFGGNDIVLSPYGPQWKKRRRIFVSEMMSNSVLENLYCLRREEVQKSLRHILENMNGSSVDIGKIAYTTVLNTIMSMFWGEEVGRMVDKDEFRKAAEDLVMVLGKPNVFELFPALTWLDVQGIGKEAKRVMRVFERMFDLAIELKKNMMKQKKCVDKSEANKDFLEFLLELSESENEAESIGILQIKAILMDILIGGSDTTATTIEWAMAELLKHPEEMRKVQDELTQVVGLSNMVQESQLNKLSHLNAVIKETLRLHPPLPLIVPRTPSETVSIGGYLVPKDTKVFINAWAMHRDPNVWEHPSEFRPERFLNTYDAAAKKRDYSGQDFSFIPFGSGRRICAGLPLAERMMSFVIASFLHSFEWELPHGAELEFSYTLGLVVKKCKPILIVPTPRLDDLELYTTSQC